MKKLLLLLTCFIVVFSFSACESEEAPPLSGGENPDISTPSEEESGEVELPKVELS